MNYLRIIVSVGLSSLFVTLINCFHFKSFDLDGIIIAVLLLGYGFYKIHKKRSEGLSFGYIVGFISATSFNSLVLGIILATFSSPFLLADTVTIALNEVMTFNHWLSFIIGLILMLKGFFKFYKSSK